MASDFSYEIVRHLGVIENYENGWNKEINIVSWNAAPAKIDIRDWSPDHSKMGKGISLTRDQFRKAYEIAAEKMPGLLHEQLSKEER